MRSISLFNNVASFCRITTRLRNGNDKSPDSTKGYIHRLYKRSMLTLFSVHYSRQYHLLLQVPRELNVPQPKPCRKNSSFLPSNTVSSLWFRSCCLHHLYSKSSGLSETTLCVMLDPDSDRMKRTSDRSRHRSVAGKIRAQRSCCVLRVRLSCRYAAYFWVFVKGGRSPFARWNTRQRKTQFTWHCMISWSWI